MASCRIGVEQIRELFEKTGLGREAEEHRGHGGDKKHQALDYLVQIQAVLRKLSTKRTIVLMDCGYGLGYLSFAANYYCTEVLKRDVRFLCVDSDERLIGKCRQITADLGYGNMEFQAGDIIDFVPDGKPDVVYSLHACDTGTDQTIAKGIREKARFILSVSCCQRTARRQIRGHPLTSLTRFSDCKERLADMVVDAMRSLLLEDAGYRVKLFEYSPARHSPKNLMLRAERCQIPAAKAARAMTDYRKLGTTFNVRPALETYLATPAETRN